MIDTPFQLLDSNSEETGLVCGIDGCSIEPSTQPLEILEKVKKQSLGGQNGKTKGRSLVRCYIGHYCHNYGLGVTVT